MKEEKRGYVLVTVAILLFVLIGFVALAVDLGILYSARTAAQRAADAAALAGALVFVVDTTPEVTDIQAKAVASAAENAIMGTPVTIVPGDVTVDMANRRVTVRVDRTQARGNPVDTYFARLFLSSADVAVVATAEASTVPTSTDCPKPWMVPSTAFHPPHISPCQACEPDAHKYDDPVAYPSTADPWGPWPGFDPSLPPPPDGYRSLLDPSGNVTEYARWLFGEGSPVPATQFIIKPQSPFQALVPSNFYPIQVSGSGAANYRADIASCGAQVRCFDQYEVETGNMVGPTGQGTNDLVSLENRSYGFVSPDHRYTDSGGQHRAPNPQLTAVPVWNACSDPLFVYDASAGQCPAEVVAPGGGTTYTVHAFAQIFVEGMSTGKTSGVQTRLITLTSCAGGGGNIDTSETGPLALPVRLVRVPAGG
jgi:Flp pilus assembly protein TadG